MSNLSKTITQIFNEWFLKQHGMLPHQAIDRIAELERAIIQANIHLDRMEALRHGHWSRATKNILIDIRMALGEQV